MRATKAQRRAWWHSLTDEERYAYQQKKMAQKPKRTNFESNCTVFPVIDSSNRQEWRDKILRMNPWLNESVFEHESIDAQDLQSITQELKAATA
ncbi:hypothetical protein LCGC14_2990270 [marine sediment metagenome]|uniref:Uncharacterized protein n=1 Tax=marine sediment metagenome TaxID=412755 RepID=A0A0F8XRK3_9ZZZZ